VTVPVSLAEIVAALGGELVGDGAVLVNRLAPLATADERSLSFLAQARYAAQLQTTAAACVIVASAQLESAAARGAAIVCTDPYLYFARLTQWWAARLRTPLAPGIHASAVVEAGAMIAPTAHIGAMAYVGAGVIVGEAAVIGAFCHLGDNAHVGAMTRLYPRVTVGEACAIGDRGVVHSGVVIGADGFGFAPTPERCWEKIEQLGAVVIGDGVEIGANTCIDRGALDDTRIGNGVKLDNLIQVGHNVVIGAHCAMAGCVGIAGSARIGERCTAGGGAIILGHLELVADVHITAATVVTRSILKPGQYSGLYPFEDNASWEKNAATLRQLHSLRDRLRALERKS
jgi:UDP-3-O-[3-hydroxymyristoyl] glucosamine N-acyltransferase